MSEPDAIDLAALEELLETTGGDPAFLAELIDAYLDDARHLLGAMRAALADGDAAGLRRAAHSLKSNSATFGAHTLVGRCQDLEQRGKSGTLDGASTQLGQVEAEYEKVRRALQAARPAG